MVKKVIKQAKDMGKMFKEFGDAWKGREASYKKHMGKGGKSKK
tara:strand:- start:2141 stop:2269 length:129 start_codon:yes stop_codon:yes gene_type:complete